MRKRKHKDYSYWHRWLSFILCLALCLGSSSLQVMAAEEEAVYALYEEQDNMPAEAEEGISDNTEDTENQDDATQQQEESADPDEEDTELTDDSSEGQPDEEASEDVQEDIDNTSDSISDNALEAVSDNSLSSISENDLDAERSTLVKAAEEAFAKLAEDKMLMALLYHTDTYGVHSQADINSSVTATIEIGTTLYLQGVKITDEEIWYQVQFWSDGAEQSGFIQSYYLAYSDEDWIAWEEKYVTPLWKTENEFSRSAYGMATYAVMESAVDYSDISTFPSSYQGALRKLKATHPNWTFVPKNTNLDFNTV
ncbi:MAG: MSCRAMM family adhesin SdrC, partial [Lachnospiraceae bacterium]|nr:MSCRAMM family adhesin SdrC [Lachnospiraceae bacterium]